MADKYPNVQVAPETNLGALSAQCGPAAKQKDTPYFSIGTLVMAVLSFIAPFTFLTPKPGDETAIITFSMCFGVFFLLLFAVITLVALLEKPAVIFAYEKGVVIRSGDDDRQLGFTDIKEARVNQWFENRFAPEQFNISLVGNDGKTLRICVDSNDDSVTIIDIIKESVESFEYHPFSG
ncbi:MAG: hypothetical protein AAFU85_16480 [Planctomycetota bacterium]